MTHKVDSAYVFSIRSKRILLVRDGVVALVAFGHQLHEVGHLFADGLQAAQFERTSKFTPRVGVSRSSALGSRGLQERVRGV